MAETIDDRLAAAGLPSLPRRLWLEIDEGALADNLRLMREMVGPKVAVNAVVKADAYGHGLVPVGRVMEEAGADRLCVASLDEALILRDAGIRLPILVLFAVPPRAAVSAAQADIEIVAADRPSLDATLAEWRTRRPAGAELRIHLEIETGLARAGFTPDLVPDAARRIIAADGVVLAGLWSHLARSEDGAATKAQEAAFERAVTGLQEAGIPVPARHFAATGGLFGGRAPLYEGIRIGLALYGLLPLDFPVAEGARAAAGRLRPALALKCRPLRIESIAAGTPVGYGGLWVAERETRIATLPVGYGDGWARAYAPGAQALVRGRRVLLVGSVAMDAVMVDVTDVPAADADDEFVLIGRQNGAQIVTSELARARNTIPWEVVTSIANRVPRVYHADSVLMGLRTLAGEARTDAHRLSKGST